MSAGTESVPMADEARPGWCDRCGELVPASQVVVGPDDVRRCPTCGGDLGPATDAEEDEVPPAAPWHFKVLVVGTVGYLIYRLIWFIGWLHHHV